MSVSRFPHALGNTSGLPVLDQNVYRMDKLTPTNERAPSVRMRNVTGSLPSRRSCDAWLRRRSHSMSSAVKRPKRTQRILTPSDTASDRA